MTGQRCLADASKRMELPGMRRGCRVLTQQARQGRVDGGEGRAAVTAALRCRKGCGVQSPRSADWRRRQAFGGGCEPPPAGHEDRHQHRSSRFGPSAKRWLADWYSVSVFQSAGLTVTLAGHRQHLAGNLRAGDRRWHRPSSVAGGSAWTKLQGKSTTYSVTLVKHIIGGDAASCKRAGQISRGGRRIRRPAARQLPDPPAQGRAQDPRLPDHPQRRGAGEQGPGGGRHAGRRPATWCGCRRSGFRRKSAEKLEKPAPAREFPVLFEDEHLIAIDKPAGVAVHGGSGVSFGVIEQLRQARPGAKLPGTGAPAGPRNLRHPAGGQEALGPDRSCRTSSASARPARPTWRWWWAPGRPTRRSSTCRCTSTCRPTASGG